jgi:hypothetical protein
MEKIIPFRKSDFTEDGIHISTGKFILELQQEWEAAFHHEFKPYFANVLEGHPSAMSRITKYMEGDGDSNYDFGMELINGEIDIDTNLAIEEFSEGKTVYAIGSQFHDDEDCPIFLVKNENLSEEILVLKYVPEEDEAEENEPIQIPSETTVKL